MDSTSRGIPSLTSIRLCLYKLGRVTMSACDASDYAEATTDPRSKGLLPLRSSPWGGPVPSSWSSSAKGLRLYLASRRLFFLRSFRNRFFSSLRAIYASSARSLSRTLTISGSSMRGLVQQGQAAWPAFGLFLIRTPSWPRVHASKRLLSSPTQDHKGSATCFFSKA